MKESEWLSHSFPVRMLAEVEQRRRLRARRLFACACCRRMWHLLLDPRSRRAVELLEESVDRVGRDREKERELEVARAYAYMAAQEISMRQGAHIGVAMERFHAAARAVVNSHPFELKYLTELTWKAAESAVEERFQQVSLVHCIVGNPFRPIELNPKWITPSVLRSAQAAYQERELPSGILVSAKLVALADELAQAACKIPEILGHLRSVGPHVRGCWAVDLVLGMR